MPRSERYVDHQGRVRGPFWALLILAMAALAWWLLRAVTAPSAATAPDDGRVSHHSVEERRRSAASIRRPRAQRSAAEREAFLERRALIRELPRPLNLSQAVLVALIEGGGDNPRQQAYLIAMMGRAQDPANEEFLLSLAERGADDDVGYAGQRALMLHYPGSWPHSAMTEYRWLVDDHDEHWHSYYHVDRQRDGTTGWSKAQSGWGNSGWDPDNPYFTAPAPASEWREFLDEYPDFMSADDAHWHLARAMHYEGESPIRVLEVLDDGLSAPDGDARRLLWAGLRHYIFERLNPTDLGRLMHRGDFHPDTRYALHYAWGLHHFRELAFARAADIWSDLPELSDRFRWRNGQPARRIEVAQQLAEHERDWRNQRNRSGEADAFLDLFDAIRRADIAVGYRRGLFEPWLLIDNDLHHSTTSYVLPHLERLQRRNSHPEVRARLDEAIQRLNPRAPYRNARRDAILAADP